MCITLIPFLHQWPDEFFSTLFVREFPNLFLALAWNHQVLSVTTFRATFGSFLDMNFSFFFFFFLILCIDFFFFLKSFHTLNGLI